jgi:hypothetical protein
MRVDGPVLAGVLLLVPAACRATDGGAPAIDPALRLERALDTIRREVVEADVVFLSDDLLAGRDTPSRGLRVAARYLRNRAIHLGAEPGAEHGWFDLWLMHERSLDAERTAVTLELEGERLALRYGASFAVHPSEIVDGEWSGELVWCGSGSRRDLEGVDLSGRWALCREKGESRTRRRRRAGEAGALGVVTIAAAKDDETVAERFAGWGERTGRTQRRTTAPDPSERLPVFWVDEETGARLLPDGEPELGAALGVGIEAATHAFRPIELENVCAYFPGSDPELAREVVLVSAHYDHVGVRRGEIYNGADDNASGSAALLALAEALVAHGPFPRSVLLLWVSGEELGLLGAAAWAEEAWLPDGVEAICNINMDMVGRNDPGMIEYTPTPEHPQHNLLAALVAELAPLEGFDDLRSADRDYERSDHAAFARALDIPVVYISAGEHEDYHQPTDTAEKVDDEKVARFARLTLRLIAALQSETLELIPPPFDPDADVPDS